MPGLKIIVIHNSGAKSATLKTHVKIVSAIGVKISYEKNDNFNYRCDVKRK